MYTILIIIITVTIVTRGSKNLPALPENWQGPVQHQDVVQVSLRVSRGQQQSIKPNAGPSEHRRSCSSPKLSLSFPGPLGRELVSGSPRVIFIKASSLSLHTCAFFILLTDFRTLEFHLTPKAASNAIRGIEIQSQAPNQRPGQAGTLDKLEQRSHLSPCSHIPYVYSHNSMKPEQHLSLINPAGGARLNG